MWNIDFFKETEFIEHVKNTLSKYDEAMRIIDFEKFNKNIIDPIKLTFDMKAYNKNVDEVIGDEIQRQRDKTVSNAIGYFHQNLFKLIKGCEVPEHGFDVIYTNNDGSKIYVELKNKHNTMNAASSRNTYIKMMDKLNESNNPKDTCYLVEAIAAKSQNIPWKISGFEENERIRRVSIDKFYEEITGDELAFKKICDALPDAIDLVVNNKMNQPISSTVLIESELNTIDENILKALYKVAFGTYNGFKQ